MRHAGLWMLVFATGAACHSSGPPVTPADAAACQARRARTEAEPWRPEDRDIALYGRSFADRQQIRDASQRGLVVLRVDPEDCDVGVRVLACSRAVRYQLSRCTYACDPPAATARSIANLDALGVSGARELSRFSSASSGLVLEHRISGASRIYYPDNATEDAARAERWDLSALATDPLAGPELDRSELVGPECASATHYVRELTYGSFDVLREDAALRGSREVVASSECHGAGCAEAIGLRVRPITNRGCPRQTTPSPQGCVRAVAPVASFAELERRTLHPSRSPGISLGPTSTESCRVPVAGQMTEQCAQAFRLFRDRRWSDALPGLERVMMGDTGDDLGNRQFAAVAMAAALHHAGFVAQSNFMMDRIVAWPCHLGAAYARVWLAFRP